MTEQTIGLMPEEKLKPERPEWLIKPLRTLRGDIEEVVKEGRTSAVKIAVAETQRATGVPDTVSNFTAPRREVPWKNILIGAAGAILIAAGGAGLYFIYKKVSAPEPTIISAKRQTIINTETEKTLDISDFARSKIIATLKAEKTYLPKNLSTVTNINFIRKTGATTTEAVASGDFLEQLQVQANTPFVRALAPDFVFGFHILGQPEPFLILKASAYDFAYAGMLRWENYLAADLGPIFLATTTPSNLFEDKIIYNKDARVLRGADGAIRLLYSFNDKNTIIITTNEITFKNLVDRLRAAKLIR
ncbi:MAG: hypothetical protein AAB806_00845 [Patescibacteria group bacterium]